MALDVRDNVSLSRYELWEDSVMVGVADYRLAGDRVVIPHTEIDRARRGQGLGEVLVQGALEDIRRSGRTVVPRCWFVAEFVAGHPEFAPLVDPGHR